MSQPAAQGATVSNALLSVAALGRPTLARDAGVGLTAPQTFVVSQARARSVLAALAALQQTDFRHRFVSDYRAPVRFRQTVAEVVAAPTSMSVDSVPSSVRECASLLVACPYAREVLWASFADNLTPADCVHPSGDHDRTRLAVWLCLKLAYQLLLIAHSTGVLLELKRAALGAGRPSAPSVLATTQERIVFAEFPPTATTDVDSVQLKLVAALLYDFQKQYVELNYAQTLFYVWEDGMSLFMLCVQSMHARNGLTHVGALGGGLFDAHFVYTVAADKIFSLREALRLHFSGGFTRNGLPCARKRVPPNYAKVCVEHGVDLTGVGSVTIPFVCDSGVVTAEYQVLHVSNRADDGDSYPYDTWILYGLERVSAL